MADVLIVVASPEVPHRISIAKTLSEALILEGIVSDMQATADDYVPFPVTKVPNGTTLIVAVAGPGASFPTALAVETPLPVVLLPVVSSEDAIGANSVALVVSSGSEHAPLARVAVNQPREAAALATRLFAMMRQFSSMQRPQVGEEVSPASSRGAIVKTMRSDIPGPVLQLGLGAIDAVEAAQQRTRSYLSFIELERSGMGEGIGSKPVPVDALPGSKRYQGKVRDVYLLDGANVCVMVATGRQSAFDRHLAAVPFKGQVLNEISLWWFKQTAHIIPNHVVCSPHPNVVIGRKCDIFPIEFVVRGYMTGSTSTSMWTHYNNGERVYCGYELPDGMVKNQKLWVDALVTPTTKSAVHDEPISPAEVVKQGIMTQEDWNVCESAAKALFVFGSSVAAARGLILCDTKYEFGRDPVTGKILLCDEIHTPDSSRYWIKSSYARRFAAGEEPANIDKEFLRRWFRERCDPYKDETLPEVPSELVNELSRRYILLYELITGRPFRFASVVGSGDSTGLSVDDRLIETLKKAYSAGKMNAGATKE